MHGRGRAAGRDALHDVEPTQEAIMQARDKRTDTVNGIKQVDGGYSYVITYTSGSNTETTKLGEIVATGTSSTSGILIRAPETTATWSAQPSTECWYLHSACGLLSDTALDIACVSLPAGSITLVDRFRDTFPWPTWSCSESGTWSTTPPTTQIFTVYWFEGTDGISNDPLFLGLEINSSDAIVGAAWGLQSASPPTFVRPSGGFSRLPCQRPGGNDGTIIYWAISYWL
jgi:hypothetical protein